MIKACIASPWTSAGAVVITTKPALLVGISYQGSAGAATITIKNGVTTGASNIVVFNIPATAGGFYTTPIPIVCGSGLISTNAGTVDGYSVLYSTI